MVKAKNKMAENTEIWPTTPNLKAADKRPKFAQVGKLTKKCQKNSQIKLAIDKISQKGQKYPKWRIERVCRHIFPIKCVCKYLFMLSWEWESCFVGDAHARAPSQQKCTLPANQRAKHNATTISRDWAVGLMWEIAWMSVQHPSPLATALGWLSSWVQQTAFEPTSRSAERGGAGASLLGRLTSA